MQGKTPRKAKAKDRAEPKSGPRKDLLASEVLDRAAALFAGRGFNGTSLQEVADAVGLTRTAIYYYFPSKDALLEALLEDVTIRATRILDDIERSELGPLDRIREAIRRLILWATDGRNRFKMIDRSENELPAHIAKRHLEAKRRVLESMTGLIERAIDSGEARPVDARITAFAAIGMCNWSAWWFSPEGKNSADEVAEIMADLLVSAIRRGAEGRASSADLSSLTAEIRENLDLIDRLASRKQT